MALVSTYVNQFQDAVATVSRHLGYDPGNADNATKALVAAQMAVVGTLVKALVDAGVITNAQLQAAFVAAVAETWPQLPSVP